MSEFFDATEARRQRDDLLALHATYEYRQPIETIDTAWLVLVAICVGVIVWVFGAVN